MSGGVDSSVAAVMLKKEGYDVTGITMKLYNQKEITSSKSCCAGRDIADAKKIANQFNFPHITLDYQDKFFDGVKLSRGITVGGDTGSGPAGIKAVISRFMKLDISEFKQLKDNIDQLYGTKLDDDDNKLDADKKFKIVQLVFRIKNKENENTYIISNELNYLRLIK